MKISKCQKRIYDVLAGEIQTRALLPGTFLSSERELALRFHVARETIRKVLAYLEADQLITRAHGKGTLICEIPRENPVLTFLVPSPDYLSESLNGNHLLLNLLFRAIAVAGKYGWRVEVVPFSRTNSCNDIDLQLLSHLNECSRVMIYSRWYREIFAYLKARKVKVGLIRTTSYHMHEEDSSGWIRGFVDYLTSMDEVVDAFLEKHCRRIAYAGVYCFNDDNMRSLGYRRAMQRRGLETLFFDAHDKELSAVRSFCLKHVPDGVILDIPMPEHHPGKSLNYDLGLPERMKLVTFSRDSAFSARYPRQSVLEVPFLEIGDFMTEEMLKPVWKPGEYIFYCKFHNYL